MLARTPFLPNTQLEALMKRIEWFREALSSIPTVDNLRERQAAGWRPVAIEWEREVVSPAAPSTVPAPEVPYGLRVSGDCAHLEDDPKEREILFQIMELTIQDGPYSSIAEELNRRGFRTRQGQRWTPVSVFQMLPRLIEAGPSILTSEEWRQRRQKIKSTSR